MLANQMMMVQNRKEFAPKKALYYQHHTNLVDMNHGKRGKKLMTNEQMQVMTMKLQCNNQTILEII
jgi:hypothetical protein